MKVNNAKHSNSVAACSPLDLTLRDYSPSPSSSKNDTPSTTNTTNNTSNRTPTPNRTPNPIPTLPATNIIKLETQMTFQPLLTSMNHHINKENTHLQLNTNMPRIPLPNMNPSTALSLPPLPNHIISPNKGGVLSSNTNTRNTHITPQIRRYKHPNMKQNTYVLPIKMERMQCDENIYMRTRSQSSSAHLNSISSISPPTSSRSSSSEQHSYSVITSAFNHNLKVKQEHLNHDIVMDTSFESCYIFSMRCPYPGCSMLFNDMAPYQSHHIQCHQQRDSTGKLIQSKEAKWSCPDCGKISASWYNYAAHVTMHKDSCDAPWICKLPPVNKKKYIQWTDGTLICGKRCSTKHNLIKHLKALHTRHRIIDLSQSVKAQNAKRNNGEGSYDLNYRRRSPRKIKKRPRFFTKSKSVSNIGSIQQPPLKKMKMDPDAMHHSVSSQPNALPIFATQNSVNNWSVRGHKERNGKKKKKRPKSVRQQGDFVGLLLEAAHLIETETPSKKTKKTKQLPAMNNHNYVTTLQNADALLSSIKILFNSTAESLSNPVSIDNVTQLSAVLALSAAGAGSLDLVKDDSTKASINISNITDISRVSIPTSPQKNINRMHQHVRVMPNISIPSNTPSLSRVSAITKSNPAIALPKMPLPPLPPPPNTNSEKGLQSLLRFLNYPSQHSPERSQSSSSSSVQIPSNITVSNNTFNTFNHVNAHYSMHFNPLPLIPNLYPVHDHKGKEEKSDKESNSMISNNILRSLPAIQ